MEKLKTYFSQGIIFTKQDKLSRALYDKGRYGESKHKKFYYSPFEAAYLLESNKMEVLDGRNSKINFDSFVKKSRKYDKNFLIKYAVFKDIRDRGYIIKTALKFGADFRVYERGIKPGKGHAKWVLYPVSESDDFTWHDFSAKNRVAHSTKKKLLVGVVDNEMDVTYNEIGWVRP